MLADDLDVPFVELSREIEKLAGCSVREIHDLYGTNAYRRYERRALEEAGADLQRGGDRHAGRHRLRPRHLQPAAGALHHGVAAGAPEEHMGRVAAQGDTRPDGRQQGSHGRPAPHPERAPPSIRRPTSHRHQRQALARASSGCAPRQSMALVAN
jgi:hypothetical protein